MSFEIKLLGLNPKDLAKLIATTGVNTLAMATIDFPDDSIEEQLTSSDSSIEALRQDLKNAKRFLGPITGSEKLAAQERILNELKNLPVSEAVNLAQPLSPEIVGTIPTPFDSLNRLLAGGLHPGQLIVLGSRPAMGKTSLALEILGHVGRQDGRVVALFSLETTNAEIGKRLLSSFSRVSVQTLDSGRLKESDWAKLSDGAGTLSKTRVFLDDSYGITADDIASRCDILEQSEGRLDLVVVDYLQLVRGNSTAPKSDEIAEVMRKLKETAKRFSCPILLTSQINRGVECRANKRPMLSDFRESGSIQEDADVILILYRDEVYERVPENRGIAELNVAKNRSGATGEILLKFDAINGRFGHRPIKDE